MFYRKANVVYGPQDGSLPNNARMAHFEMDCQVSNFEQIHSVSFVRVAVLKDCQNGHRTQWPSATSTSAGTSNEQLPTAWRQRLLKRHPVGSASRRGTLPG